MSKPNIFQIATKELSQDGFFTWLLQWADSKNVQYNQELNKIAQNFIRILLKKSDDFQITKVNVGRQLENIDIWAEINDDIFIIIEDKTNTQVHSNQLIRYKETAQRRCSENNRQLICIYLKTGSESNSLLREVSESGYTIIDRTILLDFFNKYQPQSDIYTEFVENLNNIEKSENSYQKLPIGEWNYDSWKGFYQLLDEKIKVGWWGYVSNPNGGFLCLWFYMKEWNDYPVYIQIEQGDLCFKLGDVCENQSVIRNELHEIIARQAKKECKKEIRKPERFGKGKFMTVAIVHRKEWLGNDNTYFDETKVIERLIEYKRFLNRCLE